jgi:hypothetical protein
MFSPCLCASVVKFVGGLARPQRQVQVAQDSLSGPAALNPNP